jgi:hypothetical protein
MAETQNVVIKYKDEAGHIYAAGLLLKKETTFEELKTCAKLLAKDFITADISLCLQKSDGQLPLNNQAEFEAIPAETFAAVDVCIWVSANPE